MSFGAGLLVWMTNCGRGKFLSHFCTEISHLTFKKLIFIFIKKNRYFAQLKIIGFIYLFMLWKKLMVKRLESCYIFLFICNLFQLRIQVCVYLFVIIKYLFICLHSHSVVLVGLENSGPWIKMISSVRRQIRNLKWMQLARSFRAVLQWEQYKIFCFPEAKQTEASLEFLCCF